MRLAFLIPAPDYPAEWLELIEPALFLDHAPEAGAAFARAILSAAERASE